MLPKKRKFPSPVGAAGESGVIPSAGLDGSVQEHGGSPSALLPAPSTTFAISPMSAALTVPTSGCSNVGLALEGLPDVAEVNLADWRGHRVLVKKDDSRRYFPAMIKDITNTPSDLIVQVANKFQLYIFDVNLSQRKATICPLIR